jgi:outer membrane protein OmpA-like peptidoglycan-associated protein
VKTELTGKYGVPAARLATLGYGLSRPVDKNSTIEGRARNRRVELTRVCGK